MRTRVCALVTSMLVALAGPMLAQGHEPPMIGWSAPPYWTPAARSTSVAPGERIAAVREGMTAQAQALPSSPLPFVAIDPCRIVDTRVNVADGFHEPNFADAETRTFNFASSTDCPGLPASAAAWSVNVQFRPLSQLSYITLFPTGTTQPLVSTLVAGPAGFTADAAIVPAGTGGGIDVYCQYAGRVVIDINGYYGPQSVVTSLNTLAGDLTLAAGTNVTITPSTGTLTIAATGGPGGDVPAGSANQTLRNNGSSWVASSVLTNDGTNVGVSGDLLLPASTATTGVLALGGVPFLHDFAGAGSDGYNTFVGLSAGNFTMGGAGGLASYNVGVGAQSLLSNTTGYDNTATGYQSLYSNTTGYENTAIGVGSLQVNTTGNYNTAVGSKSMPANTTGSWNTAVGFSTMQLNTDGNRNSAFGFAALDTNTTGANNTGLGYESLGFNTTGNDNSGIGLWSLFHNTTGSENTAHGAYSLYTNTTGGQNTAAGDQSLYTNSTASENTAFGYQSLFSNNTGTENTASGFQSLYATTTGIADTASGYAAGSANVTGSSDTFVGAFSDAAAGDLTNATAIGYGAVADASNHVRIGNASVTQIGGQVAWSNLSDARAKTDVRDLDLGLDFVLALRPVSFALRSGDGRTDMGFLAQDVEALLGDGYGVVGIGAAPERMLSLRYTDLIAPLVKAVQEQQEEIASQQAEITALRSRLAEDDSLQTQITQLRRQVRMLLAARDGAKAVETIGE